MVAGTAVAIIVAGRSRPTVIAVVAVAAAATVGWVAFAAPANLRHRVTDFSSQASSGRADSWQIAWAITKAHPVDGIGLGGYRNEQIKYAASSINVQHITYIIDDQLIVHNTYLETLAELGFVGLLALGGTMAVCVIQGGRAIRVATANGDDALANAIRGLVAGSCGLLASYIFLSAEYEKPLWFTLALLGASLRVVSRTVPEPESLVDVRARTEALRVVPAVSAPV
jgi:O-antigen ligase